MDDQNIRVADRKEHLLEDPDVECIAELSEEVVGCEASVVASPLVIASEAFADSSRMLNPRGSRQ